MTEINFLVVHKLPVIFHAFSDSCLWRGIVDPQSLLRFWRTVYHPLTRSSRSSSSLRLVCITFILKIFTELYWMYCNHTTLHWFVCWLQAGFLLEQLREDESPMGPLLQACLSTLAFLFTTLPAKNPLKRAVARFPHFSVTHATAKSITLIWKWLTSLCFVYIYVSV